ncbi:EAL domain-containing protein [Spartinivicinus ruber]|uniref:EAL domain-containing protein n=1 Tax=Spartinivicinus ruber TaxID=2683272 RepID=UPI0013D85471|nr:EAL domain-containing protein [Spartinivicinus ruber]
MLEELPSFIVNLIVIQGVVCLCHRLRKNFTLALLYGALIIFSVLAWRYGYADFRIVKEPMSLMLVDITVYSGMIFGVILLYLYEGPFAARVAIGLIITSSLVPLINLGLASLNTSLVADGSPMHIRSMVLPSLVSAAISMLMLVSMAILWEILVWLMPGISATLRLGITMLLILLVDSVLRHNLAELSYLAGQDLLAYAWLASGVATLMACMWMAIGLRVEPLPDLSEWRKPIFSIFRNLKELQQELLETQKALELLQNPEKAAEEGATDVLMPGIGEWRGHELLDNPSIQVFSLDMDFKYTFFNETHFELMKRYTKTEIKIGIEYLPVAVEFSSEDEGIRFFNQIVRGETVQVERRYELPDQEAEVFDFRYTPMLSSDGFINGVTAFAVNITEQHRAIGKLVRSEQRWQLALEGSQDGIWDWEIHEGILFYSPRWYEMLGYSQENMILNGEEWLSLIHPEDRERTIKECQAHTCEDSEFYLSEHRKKHRDGHYIWVLERGKAQFDRNKKPIRMLGTLTDITRRKEAEERLKRSEEQLRYAFEVADEGIWDYDLVTQSIFYSPQYIAMLGYASTEFENDPQAWLQYVHPDDLPKAKAFISDHICRHGEYEDQFRMYRSNGELIHVLSRGKVVDIDVEGNPRRVIGIHKDISERVRRMEQIENLAFYDSLTNLPNRRLLMERARQSLAMAKRQNKSMGVMVIDLDKFKQVNDTLGHDVGDAVLIEIGQRVKASLREVDTLCRQGGDEFSIILPECNSLTALQLANRIREALDEPCHINEHPIELGASIGIACYPEDGDNLSELFKNADIAMYQAKHKGLHVSLFKEEQAEVMQRRVKLEKDLQKAIGSPQMYLTFQPRTNLITGQYTSVEVLTRWTHPEFGEVMPLEFIPIAENSGLIHSLGRWVVTEACRQSQEWKAAGLPVKIAVNVSETELQNNQLHKFIQQVLSEYGLSGSDLEIELTESAVMKNVEKNSVLLHHFKDIGVGVAIDDFGTGYSSLSYLNRLPISCVKIDKQFIHQISTVGGHEVDQAGIVRAIINLAKSMGIRTVAEGVETLEQQQFLQQQLCDEAQGYLFCGPVSPDEIVRQFTQNRGENGEEMKFSI